MASKKCGPGSPGFGPKFKSKSKGGKTLKGSKVGVKKSTKSNNDLEAND